MDGNENRMQKTPWVPIAIVILLGAILLVLLGPLNTLYTLFSHPGRPLLELMTPEQLMEISNMLAIYIEGRTVLALINTCLLIYLMWLYSNIYRETRSNFSLCLVLFSATLFLYSITSNPIMIWINGFNGTNIFNLFNLLPDVFTTLASAILIYLSRQ
jgi:hypothetical protein